jgi:hypothetical protein
MIWIIIFILIIILTIPQVSEYYNNLKLDVGNQICIYFYRLGLAILQKKNFNNVTTTYTIYDDIFFFKSLPTFIKYEFDDIYNCLISKDVTYDNFSNIDPHSIWELRDNRRIHFWTCMKPLVHKILDNTFKNCGLYKNVNYPIIHFRCADTPFIKHFAYHFQYYSFFKKALEKISIKLNKKYDNLYIMSCSFHKSNDHIMELCNTYSNSLRYFLKKHNYNSEIICNSNIDDLATLFYAPAVISTSSSFSFMSGFFGNGVFITTENAQNSDCTACNDIMLYNFNLSHEKVDSYYDTDIVIAQLANK